MKYLLILIVLAILFLLIYRRLRPYIVMAQQMFGMVRDARRMGMNQTSEPTRRTHQANSERLLRCTSCNTWIPAARAFKSSSTGSHYCSSACLESASEPVRRKRASSR